MIINGHHMMMALFCPACQSQLMDNQQGRIRTGEDRKRISLPKEGNSYGNT